jgi:hypothetical protein
MRPHRGTAAMGIGVAASQRPQFSHRIQITGNSD